MVRSQIEYCSPLWNPVKISSIQESESVQKVFTSKISGMTELNYWIVYDNFILCHYKEDQNGI